MLTSQRLLFRPLDLAGVTKLAENGIDLLPDNLAVLGKIVDKILDYSKAYADGKAGAINTAAIISVRAGREKGLFNPPSLVVATSSGRNVEIGVLASIKSPNPSPKNTAARDAMVQAINEQLQAAHS